MANLAAIRSVGHSLAAYLNNAYRLAKFPASVAKPECDFSLVSIGDLTTNNSMPSENAARVLILLYRVNVNEHLRNAGRLTDRDMVPVPLSVDLHYLFSFWAQSADNEQLAVAWTLRQMHEVPLLDNSVLSQDAEWAFEDIVQLIPEEISNEDMMRIWDTLEPQYHLSFCYVARVVRIDPDETRASRRVVATRLDLAVPRSQS